MSVQSLEKTASINYKNNVIPFKSEYPVQSMPADYPQQELSSVYPSSIYPYPSQDDVFIAQTKAIQNAERKEQSRERWSKLNTIFNGMIGIGVLGSLIMMASRGRSHIDLGGLGGGFKPSKSSMGDSTLEFTKLVKDSLPKLDSDCINPKTRDFIKTIKDRLALSDEIVKYSGSKSAERCLLIHGPTGTGKTFSAKLLANELDAEYTEVDFPKIASKYVGEAASNIKNIFENAVKISEENPDKKYLIAFNEIDSMLIPMEKAGSSNVSYVLENRTAFLNGLDLVKDHKNITIVGTTNANPKKGQLDFASLGRFGNIFEIELPTEKEIKEALKWHLRDCEAATKHDFFGKNKSQIDSFVKKLHKKKFSQRDVEKLANSAQTRFGIDIAKKSSPLNEKFNIKYLEEALKAKGETTGEMQNGVSGAGEKMSSAWQRFKAGIGYWLFGGKKAKE